MHVYVLPCKSTHGTKDSYKWDYLCTHPSPFDCPPSWKGSRVPDGSSQITWSSVPLFRCPVGLKDGLFCVTGREVLYTGLLTNPRQVIRITTEEDSLPKSFFISLHSDRTLFSPSLKERCWIISLS